MLASFAVAVDDACETISNLVEYERLEEREVKVEVEELPQVAL